MGLGQRKKITLELPGDIVERIDALQANLQAEQRGRAVDRAEMLSWILSRGLSAIEKDQEALL